MTKYFFDTNALLELQEKAFAPPYSPFVVSSKTLEEIENIKTSDRKDQEIKYKARKLARLLDSNSDKYKVAMVFQDNDKILDKFNLSPTPDSLILSSAYMWNIKEPIKLISNDINCKVLSREIFGLETEGLCEDTEKYTGFKEVRMPENEMSYFYEHLWDNKYECLINEYLIIRDVDSKIVDQLKWNGERYIPLNSKSFKSRMFGVVKPIDNIQKFAFDSILSNEITALYGKAGSGKTTIPLAYILQNLESQKVNKCHLIYDFEPLKGARTLGYEKGSHTEKILNYGALGNILGTKFGDCQFVESLIGAGTLNIIPTANIRGVEFGEEDLVFVTEAQNLDVYTLKTIIQRCKSGCKQIYEGDILEQSDVNRSQYGMKRLIEVFKGYKNFGCVELSQNHRSPICDLADKM